MAAAGKGRRKVAKSRLPEPLPSGFVVNDTAKKSQWIVGTEIGSGGFGRVYLSSDGVSKDHDYVLKVEFHQNGPLFSEMHCYMCFGKPSQIDEWTKKNRLPYLGLSPTYGFGSFEYNETKYRFLVLQRFGTDLNEILKRSGYTFSLKNAYTVAISVLNAVEYIHSFGYVHLDIKAANLLLGRKKGTETQVYLLDLGLSTKYIASGEHRKDAPDPKKAHNGTIEFMSRDSHRGAPCTRRADFETLGFNLILWLGGSLPWMDVTDCVKVMALKEAYMADVKKSLLASFADSDVPPGLTEYLRYVKSMKFEADPNYESCRKMFEKAIVAEGGKHDGRINVTEKKQPKATASAATSSCKENVKGAKLPAVAKKTNVKRKRDKPLITLDPDIKPTPAMLAILNKKT